MVFTTNFAPETEFNIYQLLAMGDFVTWSKRFPHRVKIKPETPRYTALVNANGFVTLTGVRHEDEAMTGLHHLCLQLRNLGIEVNTPQLYCVNVSAVISVASFTYQQAIEAAFGIYRVGPEISYEPELFPGMHYSPKGSKQRAILFHTGKIIITGCKSRHETRVFGNFVLIIFNLEN